MKKNVSIKVKNLVSAAFAAVMLFSLLAGCQASSDPQKATDSAYGYGSSQTSTTQAAKPDGKDEGTVSAQKPDPSKPDGSKDSTKPDPAQPSTETSGKDESKPSAGNSGNTGSGSGNGSAEPSTGGTGNGSSGNGGSGGNSSKPTTGNSGSGSGNGSGNGSQPSTGGSGNQGSGSGSGNSGNGSSGSGSNPSTGGSGNQGGNSGSSGNQGGSSAPSTPADPKPTNPPAPTEAPKPTNPAPSNPAPTNPPHTHSYKAVQTVKPTCNTKGYTVYKCSCGDSYQSDEVPATGHSWGDWVVTIEPTVEAEGRRTKTCSVCGMTESQDIPKLDPPPTTPSTPVSLNMRDVEAAVLKYINQFRNEQGNGSMVVHAGMTSYVQYRAQQLTVNYAHDRADEQAAADACHWAVYNPETGHWVPLGGEAIAGAYAQGRTADEIGYAIAKSLRDSAGHWSYIGAGHGYFAGVGCALGADGIVYCDVAVYDEFLNDEIAMGW